MEETGFQLGSLWCSTLSFHCDIPLQVPRGFRDWAPGLSLQQFSRAVPQLEGWRILSDIRGRSESCRWSLHLAGRGCGCLHASACLLSLETPVSLFCSCLTSTGYLPSAVWCQTLTSLLTAAGISWVSVKDTDLAMSFCNRPEFLASLVNRNWQEARQEIQEGFIGALPQQEGARTSNGFPCSLASELAPYMRWGSAQRGGFRGLPTAFGGVECRELALYAAFTLDPWFCSQLFRSGSWGFWSFCFLLSIICPNCTCISEKAMAPHSSTLPGKSHGWRSLVGCSPWGHWESDTTERLHFHFSLSCIGEGNGNPLQCSCLESPRDGGAWWAAIYGVTQSQTRLKWLSSSSSTCI